MVINKVNRMNNLFRTVCLCFSLAIPIFSEDPLPKPMKYTMALAWIADAGLPDQYVFILNGRIAFKTVAGFERNLTSLTKGSSLTWDPGCKRMGTKPLLNSEIQMRKFRTFCDSIG